MTHAATDAITAAKAMTPIRLHPNYVRGELPASFVPLRLLCGGRTIEIARPQVLVGRHSAADLRLNSSEVSRRHCRLVFDDERWQIVDLDSLNGVFVNGERVHEATLYEKDEVRLGDLTFEVRLGEDATQSDLPDRPPAELLRSIVAVLPEQRKAS